jgi:hypothetical protein
MSKPLPTRPEPSVPDKKPAAAGPKPKPPRKPSPWPWAPWVRVLASCAIAFHLLAVFAAPWYIQLSDVFEPALPPGRAPRDAQGRVIPLEQLDPRQYPPVQPIVPQALASQRSRFPLIWHYANLLYIDNGYDFFSPDPSFNHLIRYEVFDSGGKRIEAGEFPNWLQQWPRLLYHRYMMLVDQSSDPRAATAGWELKIADRLLAMYGGDRVHLTKVRHHLLMPEEVLAGRRLNDETTYEVLGELDHRRSDAPPAAATRAVAIPGGAR